MCRAPGLEGFGSLSGLLGCTGRFPLQEKEPERTKARDDRDRDGRTSSQGLFLLDLQLLKHTKACAEVDVTFHVSKGIC